MKRILLLVCVLLLALPALAEEAVPTAEPTPSPTPNSIVEGGYEAPATPTPVPTPEPPPLRDDPVLLHIVEIAHRIDILAENERFMSYTIYASEEEIEALVIDAIAQTEAKSMKDIGKVMAVIMPKTKGKADGKVINNFVKKHLS